MRMILTVVSSLALAGCALPRFYLGNDSDVRLLCRASISIKHIHGIKIRCTSDLEPNEYLRTSAKNE